VLFAVGQTFVITSTWALGITGTFLGDYFGILMDHRVEGFPFNVLRDPMYVGSTMCFAATALWYVTVARPWSLLVKELEQDGASGRFVNHRLRIHCVPSGAQV
jgi:phosphatidylethanolamine/phosphatidyl-N-methylethanolamine N-methyltransferase